MRYAVAGLPLLRSDGSTATCPAWCCDIIAPPHESGEVWKAVISADKGKLYAVEFRIGDGAVTLVGDPQPVEKTTEYDYVDDLVAAADAAGAAGLEAAMAKSKSAKDKYQNADGTFKGPKPFDTCVAYMQTEDGG